MKKEYILIIDSGVGGLSILAELYKILPANYLYFADNKHCPYGMHKQSEITQFVTEIISFCRNKYTIRLVILACNTATTASIFQLRNRFSDIAFVGTEPAIKLAQTLKFNRILSITTPATATQTKYIQLKNSLTSYVKTLPMPAFASNIEQFLCRGHILDEMRTKSDIYFIKNHSKNFDCIVLGCTHYATIKPFIQKIIKLPLIDGNLSIARQVKQYAKKLDISQTKKPNVRFILSSQISEVEQIYKKIFGQILAK